MLKYVNNLFFILWQAINAIKLKHNVYITPVFPKMLIFSVSKNMNGTCDIKAKIANLRTYFLTFFV